MRTGKVQIVYNWRMQNHHNWVIYYVRKDGNFYRNKTTDGYKKVDEPPSKALLQIITEKKRLA